MTDFKTITACGECCAGCSKKIEGLCLGCIEADGRVPEWAESGRCRVHACAREHGVQFCGLCKEFPCERLPKIISWNANIIDHLSKLRNEYFNNKEESARKANLRFEFRYVRQEEAEEAADIERRCFPPNEACTPERMKRRIRVASDFFLVAIDPLTGRMAGFVNGIATQENKLRDEFFTDESLHDPSGPNIMILGVAVLPEYRGQGLARELVSQYSRLQRERNRRMLVLTCLEDKVKMYEKFGFRDRGESSSAWGGETWHEMEAVI
ncbi:MAG: GNAT family N-acetyltransferase [Lachnospiraceae bacterium]|nr:GNAT family N-acetyltransferase [Lachnospiraceae bacterium]